MVVKAINTDDIWQEFISPETVQTLVDCYHYHDDKEGILFFEDISRSIKRVYNYNLRELDDGISPEIAKIKAFYDTKYEFMGMIRATQNLIIINDEWSTKPNASGDYIEYLKKAVGESYTLQFGTSVGTAWDNASSKRIRINNPLLRITHKATGAYIDFVDTSDEMWIHVLIFHMPPSHQGNYFLTKNRFRAMFDIITGYKKDCLGAESLILRQAKGAPPVKAGGDWRFKGNKDDFGLLRFWHTVGGQNCNPDDPDRLYFINPSDTALKTWIPEAVSHLPAIQISKHSMYTPQERIRLNTAFR